MLKTMLDIIQIDSFRQAVFERLASVSDSNSYVFPKEFPMLYRYTRFDKYSVNDIIANNITATLISEFNDVFDGALHRYNDRSEILKEKEKNWHQYNGILKLAGLDSPMSYDDYIKMETASIIDKDVLGHRTLGYLGSYICCFSTVNDSILMWSHYADSNQGVCLSYDFNSLKSDDLMRSWIFPVAYTSKPLIIPDVMENNLVTEYQTEYNVLCNALTKFNIWEYEKEWRLFFQNIVNNYPYEKRMSLKMPIKPNGIYFGWHFFKQFFHYDDEDKEKTYKKIDLLYILLDYLENSQIDAYFMVPKTGEYVLCPRSISIKLLKNFIHDNIQKNYRTNVKFYTVFLSSLAILLEEAQNA